MTARPVVTAGVLLGIGMGGFADGILLHQILQLHNMLSAVVPKTTLVAAEINMFWDGLFHALTWGVTLLGLVKLWSAGRQRQVFWSGRALAGSMVLGWGLFNLVEGVLDHHVLQVHHVVERLGLSAFDWAFLGIGGVGLILVGWGVVRSAVAEAPRLSDERAAPWPSAPAGRTR
jgi:uncharacterized membrane protein